MGVYPSAVAVGEAVRAQVLTLRDPARQKQCLGAELEVAACWENPPYLRGERKGDYL